MSNNEKQWFYLRDHTVESNIEGTSPDIIIGDENPDPDYAQQYDKVFNKYADFKAKNYIYVRALNKDTEPDNAVGSVSVFVVHLTDLHRQALWTRLVTSDGVNVANIQAKPEAVGVNRTALIWEPDGAPAPEAPYCLIAEITGDDYPLVMVPKTVVDKKSFDTWIAGEPRLAYLMIEEAPVVVAPTPVFAWEGYVNLENKEPVELFTSLTCTSGPENGKLSFVFDEKDIDGEPIGIGDTLYKINIGYSQTRMVPAFFNSKVTVNFKPETSENAQAAITFKAGIDVKGTTSVTPVVEYQLNFGQTLNPK